MYRKLSEHPLNKKRKEEGKPQANAVLMRGCGIKIEAESFDHKYNTKAVSICPTAILAGLCLAIGIPREVVPGTTGDYHTNLMKKAEAAADLLYKRGYNFCFLHVKGYDEAGHDKLLDKRIDFVRKTDAMIGHFVELTKQEGQDCLIAVTGDHSTPLYKGDHSFEPVQFTMSTKQAMVEGKPFFLSDNVSKFDEIDASLGCLGRFPGTELMKLLFKVKDRIAQNGYV